MSEKDLEQFNADVQENEAAAAAPVDNASPEAIGEAIKEINGEADASAAFCQIYCKSILFVLL